ncbi:MAG: hypothetical protein NC418_05750 [Muribaculaceae bacterium]|nr:hypothetical protein [Muribaculaceae bacterium]
MASNLRTFSTIAGFLVAVAGTLAAYCLTPMGGLMVDDECYQALATRSYMLSPMAPLTYFIGNIWTSLTSDTILSLRYFQLIFQAVAIGIGAAWCYRRTHSAAALSLTLFGALMVASKLWGMNIFNWDTGAYPFIMLCLVSTLAYSRRPDMPRALAMAGTWALATAARVPLAAALPFLAALVLWRHRLDMRTAARQLGAGALLALAILLALVLLIYGSFSALASAWDAENIINGHSPDHTAYIYSRLRFTLICVGLEWYISIAILLSALAAWKARTRLQRVAATAAGTGFIFIVVSAVELNTGFDVLFGTLQPLTIGVCLVPAVASFMRRRPCRISMATAITLFFIALPAFGSDSFLERFFVIPVLPVACGLVYRRYGGPVRMICLFLTIAVAIAGARFAYSSRNHHIRVDASLSEQFDGLALPQEMYENMQLAVEASHYVGERYGRPVMIVPSLFYLATYGTDTDVMLGLHHFHFMDFESDIPHHRRLCAEGRPYIVSSIHKGYIDTLRDFLHTEGYVAVDSFGHCMTIFTKDVEYPVVAN